MPTCKRSSSSSSLFGVFVLLLLLILTIGNHQVSAQCRDDQCEHGTCFAGFCDCDAGYMGSDCSVPFETCADGHTCMNGSVCVRGNKLDEATGKYKYHCDCQAAFDVNAFAGRQCEHAATTICEQGVTKSIYAFCTNGGTCIDLVVNGAPHEGCECPAEFEGAHCQYLLGTAPDEEIFNPYADTNSGRRSMTAVSATFTTLMVFLFSVLGIFLFYRSQFNEKEMDSTLTGMGGLEEHQAMTAPSIEVSDNTASSGSSTNGHTAKLKDPSEPDGDVVII